MAAGSEKDLAKHLEAIRADLAALSDTVSELVSDTAGMKVQMKRHLRDAARTATAAGEHMLHEAEQVAGEALHAAARSAGAAVHGVEARIERNPMAAVLIALGAGLALGFLTRK
jgi:ElaB/YqjD/DUF883 family membrane-anchored ribosome-binding protein